MKVVDNHRESMKLIAGLDVTIVNHGGTIGVQDCIPCSLHRTSGYGTTVSKH